MDLSTELAQRCLQVKQAAEDPMAADRETFEDLAARERVSREQAGRWKDIARGRAREEAEKTPWETFSGRLYPVPHTLGEAAWRLPLVAAGGAVGHSAVAKNELPDTEAIRRILQPTLEKKTTKVTPLTEFGQRVHERLKALGKTDAMETVQKLEQAMIAAEPGSLLSGITSGVGPAATPADRAARYRAFRQLHGMTRDPNITGVVHEEATSALAGMGKGKKAPADPRGFFRGLLKVPEAKEVPAGTVESLGEFGKMMADRLRAGGHSPEKAEAVATELQNIFRKDPERVRGALGLGLGKETGAMRKQVLQAMGGAKSTQPVREALHDVAAAGKYGLGEGMSKWKRYGGAGLGAALTALATGLPLGAYALWKRREGGEAAARAKARMEEEVGKAEEASRQREEILARMGA